MRVGEALEPDRELDVARADDVLDLELGELGVEAELLDDARVPVWRKAGSARMVASVQERARGRGTWATTHLREASRESSSDLAPVTTILPLAKMSAVVFGSRMRMMTAAKRW